MMKINEYHFELECKGEHRTLKFVDSEKRDEFYSRVVNHFSGKELPINSKEPKFVFITIYNDTPLGVIANDYPRKMYDESLCDEILSFVVKEYEKISKVSI